MTYYIDIQNASSEQAPITDDEITKLVTLVLESHLKNAELTVRLVDAQEMYHLNSTYRKQNKTTNVLAFPYQLPSDIALECPLLGDVIICPEVLENEAIELKKPLLEHWTLILIHGILHLLGYDHIKDDESKIMQELEIKLLTELGYSNPYSSEEYHIE